MSEILKKQAKCPVSKACAPLAVVGLFLSFGAADAFGEGLEAYGARMCAESGILPEDCSLVSDPAIARQAELVRNEARDSSVDKTPTLLEHGQRICEQENVPPEDCHALPAAYRAEPAAPAFLTVPSSVPPVDPALVPPAPSPMPATRHVVRDPPPPAPLPARPLPAAPVLAGDPEVRYLRPPSAAPVDRFAPALPLGPDRRYAAPPPEPVGRPIYRFAEEPAPVVERGDVVIIERERPERLFQEERTRREERFFREERFVRDERFPRRERVFLEERSGRCLRAVRYSAPPSYRYITC